MSDDSLDNGDDSISRLDAIEAKREARRAGSKTKSDEQKATDLEAIDVLEEEYGDSCIAILEVPYNPVSPMPVLCAVRCPKPSEMKRYRDQIKLNKKGHMGGTVVAASAIATVCRVYPDKETYDKLCEDRPGIHVQMGTAALNLSAGTAEAEGKE